MYGFCVSIDEKESVYVRGITLGRLEELNLGEFAHFTGATEKDDIPEEQAGIHKNFELGVVQEMLGVM